MYKNLVWFTAGYITCKHVVPVLSVAILKANARMEKEVEKQKEAS